MKIQGKLKAGVGVAIISPDEPEKLRPTGMTRLGSTLGVLDDLRVEALAVSVGDTVAFMLSSDLRMIEEEWLRTARDVVAATTGCDPKKILFSSRHNHCSNPEPLPGADGADDALARAEKKIVDGLSNACIEAFENLRPAELASFTCRLKDVIGEVRRMQLGNGTAVQCWGSGPVVAPGMKLVGPLGEPQMEIDALTIREPGADKPFALLTSYPSHPHLYELPYFSGEWPGGAMREIECKIPGLVHVFANGACGNVDTHCIHPAPGDADEAVEWFKQSCSEIGRRFSEPVVEALGKLSHDDWTDDVTLGHSYWSQHEGEAQHGGRMMIINALTLNETAIVSLPGELFTEYGRWLHEQNPFGRLLLISYNGSQAGYIATPIAFEQGSYEVMRGPAASRETEGIPMTPRAPNIRARVETGQEICDRVISLLSTLTD